MAGGNDRGIYLKHPGYNRRRRGTFVFQIRIFRILASPNSVDANFPPIGSDILGQRFLASSYEDGSRLTQWDRNEDNYRSDRDGWRKPI